MKTIVLSKNIKKIKKKYQIPLRVFQAVSEDFKNKNMGVNYELGSSVFTIKSQLQFLLLQRRFI
jgi:hypothetical protein